MEDFGYSKHQEQGQASSIMKRAFLIGATLFSIACFVYVTINAYYFVYNDQNNNIETIKAAADPIKVVETEENVADPMRIDSSIYEDIFGNKRVKEREIKIRESAETAVPPKVKDIEAIEKPQANSPKTNAPTNSPTIIANAKNKAKSNQIIVYSDVKAPVQNKVILAEKPAPKPVEISQNQTPKSIIAPKKNQRFIRVQIAALTSKESANEYWNNLQRLYPSLFSSLKSFVEQVDLGKRGIFYRLQIGNFFDQVRAEEFCNRYVAQTKKTRADCIVVE